METLSLVMKQEKTPWTRWTLTLCVLARESGCPGCPVRPTLALMMVGLGSKMPCIFLKAGMTKRLQVTTADTGFPRTDGRREESDKRKEREKYMSNVSSETAEWITLSLNFTHYLGGQRLVCEHRPCPRWQMLLGDWKKKIPTIIINPVPIPRVSQHWFKCTSDI